MSRTAALVLLAVFGIGVFLTGLELMITAVALPAIILDFASDDIFAFSELRKASWVVNGYLLAYVVTMPLAGRLSDLWGARRLFLGALVVFIVGSAVAGAAQSLDQLIAARVLQAVGGGVLVPVGTAAASHLYSGHARPRALGVVGALTFLGMAAGPFLGAAILSSVHVDVALARLGVDEGTAVDALAPAWRWVFYVNVPIGLVALVVGWAASHGWDTPSRQGRIDILGGLVFTAGLTAALIALTLIGVEAEDLGLDPSTVIAALSAIAIVATLVTVVRGLRLDDPYLDPRLFGSRIFTSATLVSLLTGYAFATAIIGGAVFVDRVLYGGPDTQRLALGALAGATAVGALASGFLARVLPIVLVTVVGLVASAAALFAMARWTPATPVAEIALLLAVFGLGFGLTVTARSTAAVESVGRRAYGAASATVTVARMIGMAIGLAVLTAYGSTTIDRLYDRVYATETSYQEFIPLELRNRPFRDGLVVQALERWAAEEGARIMEGIFIAAAAVSIAAVPAGLAMGGRRRTMPTPGASVSDADAGEGLGHREGVRGDDVEGRLAL